MAAALVRLVGSAVHDRSRPSRAPGRVIVLVIVAGDPAGQQRRFDRAVPCGNAARPEFRLRPATMVLVHPIQVSSPDQVRSSIDDLVAGRGLGADRDDSVHFIRKASISSIRHR
jgi:hypothetical protein